MSVRVSHASASKELRGVAGSGAALHAVCLAYAASFDGLPAGARGAERCDQCDQRDLRHDFLHTAVYKHWPAQSCVYDCQTRGLEAKAGRNCFETG